jgi:anti-sigma factor (TIGR02949 family)
MSDRDVDEQDCNAALERLHEFLDGELTTERKEMISAHLESCGHCLEVFDFEAEIKIALSSRCQDVVPDGLLNRISAAIDQTSP